MVLVARFIGRDDLPRVHILLQRVFSQRYSDEPVLVPTDKHPERFRGRSPKGFGAGRWLSE
jgi:hypothetical protein